MSSFDLGALRRLALVIGLFGGFAVLHVSLAAPAMADRPEAASLAVTSQAAPDRADAGYGHADCSEAGCQVEYCAAPATSDLGGYAVPCRAGGAG